MRYCKEIFSGVFLVMALLLLPGQVQANGDDYIAIRKEGSGKIALVLSKPAASGGKESGWAERLDVESRSGLDFTGLFSLIPPPLNVAGPRGSSSQSINFGALNSVGAEFYAGGAVVQKSGNVVLSMEVYDTLGGRPILRKTYTGKESDLRSIAHAFCADLVELLTGRPSVFGSKVVFVSNRSGFKEIYMCDYDGHGMRQMTNTRSLALTPVLSPDGQHLAYTDYASGRPRLSILDLAGGKRRSVARSGNSIDPGWRSNAEVATTLSFQGDQEIYLVRPDGSLARRVTNSRGIDLSPSFSPDGNKMAFVSSRTSAPQIFILDLQTGQTKRLTYNGSYNTQPSWSPQGDKIAYSTMEKNGEINIFTINTDGSSLRQLTSGSRQNESPSWSPGGDMIVFTSSRHGQKKLFVMNAAGGGQRRLLQLEGEQMQPSWSLRLK